jgi:hypothetical protein
MMTDFLIQNCTADDFEYACPKRWSELKPSMTAAVRHCDHCNRKVYLCRTDADIKLYTSVNYCIAIAETKTQAEKEWEARFQASVTPADHEPATQTVRMMGIMLPSARNGDRQRPMLRVVPKDLDAYEIPEFLRTQIPDEQNEP